MISEHDLAAIDKYIAQAKTAQEIRVEAVNELNRLAKIVPEKFSPEIYMAEIRRIDAEFKKATARPPAKPAWHATRRRTCAKSHTDVQRITVSATEQLYRDMDEATQTSMERQLAEWEEFTAQVQALVDAGRISQEEALARNAEKTDEYLQEIEITAERMTVPVQEAIEETSEFAKQAARNMQDAFAEFLFDPFEDGLEGML